MNSQYRALAIGVGLSLSLVACHNDKAPATQYTTVTITPSLGKITKGRVVIKNLARQAISDIKPIDGNGTASFSIESAKLNEPILAEVLPAADGILQYADEAVPDHLVSITQDPNTAVLRAATSVTKNGQNIGVTALTEAAVSYAQSLSAQLTKTNIEAANQKIEDQLKLTKFDITDAPAVVGLNDFSPLLDSKLTEQQRAYATYLATLATESKRLNADSIQPAYDMANALSKDFSDGVFDAKQGQTLLNYYTDSFISAWANWVTTFYESIFKLQNIGDLTAWLNAFNVQTPNIPTPSSDPNPNPNPNPSPNTETCASRKLPVNSLSAIADYAGDYSANGKLILSLNTTAATATANGVTANIQEVCGPNVQSNGTNQFVLTDKGYIALFKDNAGKYSAETSAFGGFYAVKSNATTNVPNPASNSLCSGNTNPWGCVTIEGSNKSILFTHDSKFRATPDVRLFTPATQILNVQFSHASTPIDDGMTITKVSANHSYISFVVGGITYYQCGIYGDEQTTCPGLALDAGNRTLDFSNVKLINRADASQVLVANGRLKF